MTNYLKESIKIINANFIFVLVLALTSIWITGGTARYLACFMGILSLIVTPAIYGRFIDIISKNKATSLIQLFKEHWLNFYIVLFSLFIPLFIFTLVVLSLLSVEKNTYSEVLHILATIFHISLIYIIPLIFIKKESFSIVPIGIKYLSNNFRKTLPLIGLTFVSFAIGWFSSSLEYSTPIHSSEYILFVVAFNFSYNLVQAYITLMIFISAGIILIRDPHMRLT